MVQVANAFSAIISFFIGLVLIAIFHPVADYIIGLITDTLLRVILLGAYLLLVVLVMIYFPIMVLTSEDRPQG